MSVNRSSGMVLNSSYRENNNVIAVDINDIEEDFNPENSGIKICSQTSLSEQLTTNSIPCKQVWIQALSTNTGEIYFADVEFSTKNIPGLFAKDSVILNKKNPNKFHILTNNVSDGCKWRAIV